MAISTPKLTTTVEDFIDLSGKVPISYSILSLQNTLKDLGVDIVVFNVIDDYIDEIRSQAVLHDFSDAEYIKYYQSPKLLSNHLYGTTELDFIIMRINGIYDPKDFTMRTVKLLDKSTMNEIMSQVYNSNKRFIDEYNDRNSE